MEYARVFPCMVCSHSHLISRVQKKKMLLNYIDGNIDIIRDISGYNCLSVPSTSVNYITTRLQYKTIEYLRAIASIIRKLSHQHSIRICTLQPYYVWGPLTCHERSQYFAHLCREIITNSNVVGEHFRNIDSDESCWRKTFDETVYLMYRINRSLWAYYLRYHPRNCRDCSENV